MTGEEKRQALKEQYKKDLRLRKEFLEKTKKLKQMRNVNQAMGSMIEGMKDDSDEWIEKLNQGTALSEAKLDIALDQAATEEESLNSLAKEIEMEKMNAQLMVEQMKREMGLIPTIEVEADEEEDDEVEVDTTETKSKKKSSKEKPAEEEPPVPGKTMGDF